MVGTGWILGKGSTTSICVPAVMRYAMTADEPAQVEFMKRAGMPLTTEAKLTYTAIVPGKSIAYTHKADFIPSIKTGLSLAATKVLREGDHVRMHPTLDPMHSDEWTQRAVMGWESQLGKLARVIAN